VCSSDLSGYPAYGIAVDATSVYWVTGITGAVMKVALGGSTTPTTLASGHTSYNIAVDTTSIYWTTDSDGAVMKVALGGGRTTTLASGQSDTSGIVVDGTSVYWTNRGLYDGSGSLKESSGTVMKLTPK
jgi:hypothetical protein